MVTKVGFLADYEVLDYGEAISETDVETKYNVSVQKTQDNALSNDLSAELTVVDFDEGTTLDATNGFDVEVINDGDIKDKHGNFRDPNDIGDNYLDVARFALKDYAETPAKQKGKHEYWCQKDFSLIDESTSGINPTKGSHSTGTTLLHAYTTYTDVDLGNGGTPITDGDANIYVMRRDDSTGTWTIVNSGDPIDNVTRRLDNDNVTDPCPAFVTVPGFGTFLFYFCFGEDSYTPNNPQIVYSVSRDDGLTWSRAGSIILEPFYGKVVEPIDASSIDEYAVVLKAVYYNNKIVLGMMLRGSDTAEAPDYTKLVADKICNIVYSKDLGKSWTTVPIEFITASYEGPIPGSTYNLGTSTAYKYSIPTNFGLGYDIYSDKILLVLRGSGIYNNINPLTVTYDDVQYINKLYVFYNVSDDLFEWDSSVVTGKSYKLLDDYSTPVLDDDVNSTTDTSVLGFYSHYEYNTMSGGNSAWLQYQGTLYEANPRYTTPEVTHVPNQGNHLYYVKIADPSMRKTRGFHIEIRLDDNIDDGTHGFGWCRVDESNFYAVTIYRLPVSYTADIRLYEVSGGSATLLVGVTGADYTANTWHNFDVVFEGCEIYIYLDGLLVISDTRYSSTIDTGNFFVFQNKQDDVQFDNFGLVTGSDIFNVPGGLSDLNSSRRREGANIDLTVDQFGQTWFYMDITAACISDDKFFSHGNVFQKIRLERDIERSENKFLAKNKLIAKFGNSDNSNGDAGFYFSMSNFGITPTYYGATSNRVLIHNLVWHKGVPVFFGTRKGDTDFKSFAIESTDFSNINMRSNFVGVYTPFITDTDLLRPDFNGWAVTGSYTTSSDVILQFSANESYILQSYDHKTGAANSNANQAVGVKHFDYGTRGISVYFNTKEYSSNDYSSSRIIFEVMVPKVYRFNTGGSVYETSYVGVRLKETKETGPGVRDGKYELYTYNGATWDLQDTYTLGASAVNFRENLIFITPDNLTTDAKLHFYTKAEGAATWFAALENHTIQETSYFDSDFPYIKLGCFSVTGTTSRQEFKFVGYSDTCLVDPYQYNLRGETLDTGEKLYTNKNMTVSVSGGVVFVGDTWKITDLETRAFAKENVLLRPSAEWRSENTTSNKSVVIDAGIIKEFDTIVLYGVNCKDIDLDMDDNSSFSSPETVNIDMTIFSNDFTKVRDNFIELVDSPVNLIKDQYLGKSFATGDNSNSVFRITSNMGDYIICEDDNSATMPASGTLYVLSDAIAIRFRNRKSYRYFRLTFKKGSYTQPTAETYFRIKQFAVGVFDQLQWNPEYPEEFSITKHAETVKMESGVTRQKKLGNPTVERTLNFKSIDTNVGGFQAQLEGIWKNCKFGTRLLYYIPDIEENGMTTYTYTFTIYSVYLNDKFSKPLKHGFLSDVSLQLRETN